MKPEEILDALNFIPDEWIEAVEKLRSKRKRTNLKNILAVAACICVGFLGIYAMDKAGLFSLGQNTESCDTLEISNDTAESFAEAAEESAWDSEHTQSAEESEDADWENCLTVQIQTWQTDAFIGIVTDIGNSKDYREGMEVVVKFDENSYVEVEKDDILHCFDGIPEQELLPVGMSVIIYYDSQMVSSEVDECTGRERSVLHAGFVISE